MMEVLDQELQLQTSEADQARGLIALNMAQDYFESVVSQYAQVLGDQTANITTTAGTETTTFPTGFLRLDRIQYLDPSTNFPAWDLINVKRVGGHVWGRFWPSNVLTSTSDGVPRGYYTNGRNIYWSPIPDLSTYTFRAYGFKSADDITASGTFSYVDSVSLPLVSFATRLMKLGVDDDPQAVSALANQAFNDVVHSLTSINRDGAAPFSYTRVHDA